MKKRKKWSGIALACMILLSLWGCDHEEKSIQPVGVDTVLNWQAPAEAMPKTQELPILSFYPVQISEAALENAVKTFMESKHFTYTASPPQTGDFPDSHFFTTWSDHLYQAGKDGNASYSLNLDGEGNIVSFGLSLSTFENSYIRQTFVLPDKETIPSHAYTSDRFQQGADLDFLSCEEAKAKTKEFLGNLGLPVDNLEFTIYTIDLETLQTVADEMYAAGRFIDPSIGDPFWPEGKDHTVMYKQYTNKDECYYIVVRFTYEGIPLYDDEVGLSDGTSSYTVDKMDSEIPRLQWLGPSVTCCWSRTASPMRGLVPEYA